MCVCVCAGRAYAVLRVYVKCCVFFIHSVFRIYIYIYINQAPAANTLQQCVIFSPNLPFCFICSHKCAPRDARTHLFHVAVLFRGGWPTEMVLMTSPDS